jgi:hypothetical protein
VIFITPVFCGHFKTRKKSCTLCHYLSLFNDLESRLTRRLNDICLLGTKIVWPRRWLPRLLLLGSP